MLRDVRYYSANQTIRAVKCYITWRYWLWRARDKNETEPDDPEEGTHGKSRVTLPCRILIRFEGLEWLLYNRTMVFDDILRQAEKSETTSSVHSEPTLARPPEIHEPVESLRPPESVRTKLERSRWSPETRFSALPAEDPRNHMERTRSINEQRYPPPGFRIAIPKLDFPSKIWSWLLSFAPTFDLNDLLPIALEAKRGAIVLGNASMPTIFTVRFGTGDGTYNIGPSRSRFDEYKQCYTFDFRGVHISADDNPDHVATMVNDGKRIHEQFARYKPTSRMGHAFSDFRESMRGVTIDNLQTEQKEERPEPKPWTGLSTFMTEAEREKRRQQEQEEANKRAEKRKQEVGPEYAKERALLDTQRLQAVYYVDVAGTVPENPVSMEGTDELVDIGNGDVAPQWGVDLVMHGGVIVYGPWADRQRVYLQRALSPPAYSVVSQTTPLKTGESRLWTEFTLRVEFADETNLRIPCRESSKDWQFDHLADLGEHRRQAAQLGCKVSRNSTINYSMPLVASAAGYQTSLKVQLMRIALDSSLNGKVFMEAEKCKIICSLPSPLRWNDARQWDFNITIDRPEIYLLRDHITLFTDLGKDWSAGPPTDILYFIPMKYVVTIVLKNYSLSFNVNDQNIVDSPNDPDANTLLTLRGSHINGSVEIPSIKYRPEATTVPFSLESADKLGLWLTFPKWNTRAAHATNQLTEIGRLRSLRLDGSYKYYATVHPNFVDQLKLVLYGRTCSFKCFGWAIRHFMVLQANYFGSFTNFTLPSEAKFRHHRKETLGDPVDKKYREGQSNALEVCMEMQVTDATIALPEALLGYEIAEDSNSHNHHGIGSCLLIAVPETSLSFRLHDYAMEMTLNFHHIGISSEATCPDKMLWDAAMDRRKRKEICSISELDIIAHRLFGPRPQTATYVCIWEIGVGDISATIAPPDIAKIGAVLTSFQLNFKDELNAPAQEFMPALYPDVTFLKLRTGSLRVNVQTDKTALVVSVPQGIQFSLHDLSTDTAAGTICLLIPAGQLQSLIKSSADSQIWLEAATVGFDVALDVISRPCDWKLKGREQTNFVKEQDVLTRRVPFIYEKGAPLGKRATRLGPFFLSHPSVVAPIGIAASPGKAESAPSLHSEETTQHSDADERLAMSRPPSVRNWEMGAQESSGPDESDEPYSGVDTASDTEDMSEDEWDDDGGWPSIGHHANVVQQFRQIYDDTATGSNMPRFELVKEVRAPMAARKTSQSQQRKSSRKLARDAQIRKRGDRDDVTEVIIVSKRGIDVMLNPILVHVVQDILPAIYKKAPSVELELDGVMASFMQLKPSSPSVNRVALDLNMPSIRFRSVQSILSSEEAENLREPFGNPPPSQYLPAHSRIVSILDIQVMYPFASGVLGSADFPMTLGVQQANATLSTYDSHLLPSMHRRNSHFAKPIVELTVADSHATIGQSVHSTLGNVQVTFQAEAPAPVMATLAMAGRAATEVQRTVETWADVGTARSRYVIFAVLDATEKAQSDPLSTAVTSYLVQAGRPSQLRGDVCWKILNHARQRLPNLAIGDKEPILVASQNADYELPVTNAPQLAATLKEAWRDFTGDLSEEEIEQLPLVKLLYPSKPPTTFISQQIQPISIKTGFFQFTLEQQSEVGSHVRLGPFNIDILERRPTVTIPVIAVSSVSLARPSNVAPLPNFRHVGVVCDLGAFHVDLSPALIPFAGKIVRAQKHLAPPPRSPTSPTMGHMQNLIPLVKTSPNTFVVDLSLHFKDLTISSRAYNFNFEVTLLHPTLVLHSRLGSLSPRPFLQLAADTAGTVSCAWDEFQLRVIEDSGTTARTTLAEFTTQAVFANAAWYSRTRDKPIVRVTLGIGRIFMSVPRHISRLLQSVETWWKDYFLNQVNPLLNLIAVASSPRPTRTIAFKPQGGLTIDVQANIDIVEIRLHAVLGIWLVWQIQNMGITAQGNKTTDLENAEGSAVLRIASQTVALETWKDPDDPSSILLDHSFKFPFPPFQVSARLAENVFRCRGAFKMFEVVLNANAVDAFVRASRQLASSDLERIFMLFQKYQPTKSSTSPSFPSPQRPTLKALSLQVDFVLAGFRLVLEGESSMCFFDVAEISGEGSGAKEWSFRVSDISFSLAPKAAASRKDFDRRYRLAYMVFDLHTKSTYNQDTETHLLELSIDKVHAVLQAAALGVLGDLVDSYQAEVLRGREEVMRQRSMRRRRNHSFNEPPLRTKNRAAPTPWLDKRVVKVVVNNFGAAIPLTLNKAGPFLPSEASSVPAFLFSILSVQFKTQFGEAGDASVSRFALQFLHSFDQSNPGHFISKNNNSQNQMIYPQMQADVRSRSTLTSVEWLVNANVSGFELDLDPNIATFVFSLLDVYRHGVSSLEALADAVQTTDHGLPPSVPNNERPIHRGSLNSLNTRTTHILTSLEFQSGRVRLHHEANQRAPSMGSLSLLSPNSDSPRSEMSVDILLPVVSLWAEWRATPASIKGGSTSDELPSSLLFKSTIHSSKNTVSPTILHFVSQLLAKIENRLNKRLESPPKKAVTTDLDSGDGYAPKAFQAMSITFTLRIDQSTLDFTCKPDVNVRGGLHWESGGFVATATPGAKSVAFTGSVEGLTAYLKHDYLNDNCVEASISDLAFSAALSASRDEAGMGVSRASIVIETDLKATALFARLQDILCFKAVWFDSLTPVTNQTGSPTSPATATTRESTVSTRLKPRRRWTTALILKIRRLEAEADLGSAISKVTLKMEPLTLRTLFTERLSEVCLAVNALDVVGSGLFSGSITVPNCLFRTVRGRDKTYDYSDDKQSLLKILLESGQLRMEVSYESKTIFLYDSRPLRISILDDWSGCQNVHEEHKLLLDFVLVAAGVNIAATTSAPAVFLDMVQRIQSLLASQYEGAAAESKAYRQASVPKRKLDDVATSLVQGPSRDKAISLDWTIVQNMEVNLGQLFIGIARESLSDKEAWGGLQASEFKARLIRHVRGAAEDEGSSEMSLALGSLHLHRYTSVAAGAVTTATQWLERRSGKKEVLTVPAMRVDMKTREFLEGATHVLAYDLQNELGVPNSTRQFSIGTDLVLFDWFRDTYTLTVERFAEVKSRHNPGPSEDKQPKGPNSSDDLPQQFSLEPTARNTVTPSRSGPFERGGKQWRPESIKMVPPVIQQLGNFSPGFGFYNLVVQGSLDQALAIWIHELVTRPVSELNSVLLSLYTKQLRTQGREEVRLP
ncbi:hypothetical protein M408DRAFT_327476 [Serendipita vermifera MAFF 305830]|uniref:Csf1 N-terminal domain-containing protein n=1 Tax=Serendipita vermifera MAFF 305830 TaxID=933852 RepID=A0A0C3BGC0_SERVB|nr:hypothetical protein M408DRAFT_327476 [Serendipita vermifera MAFF 305830]